MQFALSYGDVFRPCSRVLSGDNNTIHHLKQKFTHCAIELKLRQKIITVYASVQCMYNSVTTNTYDSTRKSTFCIFTKKEN